jgi:hypothetical protein
MAREDNINMANRMAVNFPANGRVKLFVFIVKEFIGTNDFNRVLFCKI